MLLPLSLVLVHLALLLVLRSRQLVILRLNQLPVISVLLAQKVKEVKAYLPIPQPPMPKRGILMILAVVMTLIMPAMENLLLMGAMAGTPWLGLMEVTS